MKIAIVSPYISTGENLEYYQSQQLNLALELARLGVTVDIYTARRMKVALDRYSVNDKVTVYNLPVIAPWTGRTLNQYIMIRQWEQLDKEKYDFIQSSDDCIFNTFMSALYVLLKGSRLIIYQGIYRYSDRKVIRILMKLYDLTAGIVLRRACCIAVCKTQEASRFLQNKGYKRTKVIPVGVNTDIFYPEARHVNKNLELLAVGHLVPNKNYSLMIDILQCLTAMVPNVRLTVIGSGPEMNGVLNLVREKRLLNHFRLIEKVPNREMRLYYSQVDLMLLLSKTEIFGMVILEAMACGCPVMASSIPAAVDVIVDGENGFLLQDLEPLSIAIRIRDIFAESALIERVRSESIRAVHERYAWNVIASQYYDLYSKNASKR